MKTLLLLIFSAAIMDSSLGFRSFFLRRLQTSVFIKAAKYVPAERKAFLPNRWQKGFSWVLRPDIFSDEERQVSTHSQSHKTAYSGAITSTELQIAAARHPGMQGMQIPVCELQWADRCSSPSDHCGSVPG